MLLWKLFQRWKRRRSERRALLTERQDETRPAAARVSASASGQPLNAEAAVSVRELRMAYGGFEAVRGIDFDVGRGEVVAFLGPNGAGKTTTVEILEGYRRRSSGEVAVLGQDPAHPSPDWRASVGIVLQDSEPEPYLTPRECLRLYAGYFPRPAQVDEILALVGLKDEGDVATGSLSGGQRRRLG